MGIGDVILGSIRTMLDELFDSYDYVNEYKKEICEVIAAHLKVVYEMDSKAFEAKIEDIDWKARAEDYYKDYVMER